MWSGSINSNFNIFFIFKFVLVVFFILFILDRSMQWDLQSIAISAGVLQWFLLGSWFVIFHIFFFLVFYFVVLLVKIVDEWLVLADHDQLWTVHLPFALLYWGQALLLCLLARLYDNLWNLLFGLLLRWFLVYLFFEQGLVKVKRPIQVSCFLFLMGIKHTLQRILIFMRYRFFHWNWWQLLLSHTLSQLNCW